jgi:hypothetical protein
VGSGERRRAYCGNYAVKKRGKIIIVYFAINKVISDI